MADGLRARDSGDLLAAQAKFEQLLRLTPDDQNVQRLLESVNSDIARQQSGEATVFGQAATVTEFAPSGAVTETESITVVDVGDLDSLLKAESQQQREAIKAAKQAIDDAEKLANVGRIAEADEVLVQAADSLPLNTATVFVLEDIQTARGDLILKQGREALATDNIPGARNFLTQYGERIGQDAGYRTFESEIKAVETNPWRQNPDQLSPGFLQRQQVVDDLLVKGRAQYLYGDIDGALQTLREIEARDPNNAAAKALQLRIAEQLGKVAYLDREKTRSQMLEEVARAWQRPQIFELEPPETVVDDRPAVLAKLANIFVPRVSFNAVPLSRVVETLSELSYEFDETARSETERGVNMVLTGTGGQDPAVSITLRNLTMDKILDFTTESVGFTWDIRNDAVIVTRGGSGDLLETDFFPVARATVIRLSGGEEGGGGGRGGAAIDPFAAAPAAPAAPTGGDSERALRSFFQRAGVDFDGTPGSSLAFDGTQLIVTQTPRNLERLRNILRRYDQTKQVEIESKFLEVNQGNLEQLGFNWTISSATSSAQSQNRNLSQAFSLAAQSSALTVNQPFPAPPIDVPVAPPQIPGAIDLATGAGNTADMVFGIMSGLDVGLTIDALSRLSGSDLLSSPRVTVLSGRTAQIVIAQELRYPESYGDIESNVGTGSTTAGGAGVTITAGTPQDFTTRNVGVEMEVTPTVEENENISLKLEPRVTEFEGFVEYGGPSVAIQSGTSVTVPSGFYQPIFSTRTVRTEVTIYDGATVVIGGLTREEVKTVNDKVPVLGDIPLLGRLFQSKGETATKRNLLIFVTANLISPGGSPSRQRLGSVEANQLFQNPTVVTPGGGVSRQILE